MVVKDTTLKKEAPKKETTPSEKVEKTVDMRKDLTMKEAERLIELENNPEATGSQASKEEKEKTEERYDKYVSEGKIKEIEIPERYKGKTPEELVSLLDEKEKFIQGRSDEIGEWKQKVKEAEKLGEKVAKIEEEAMKQSQQPTKLPQIPIKPVITEQEYYDDAPKAWNKLTDYMQKVAEYSDMLTSAKTAPFYQSDMERRREKLYIGLEDKYKDFPVKFDRKKVQEYLVKNPEYFNQYKTKAYEQAYHDLSASDFSQTRKKEKEEMHEQVKKELIEEAKTQKQAGNVGLSDLETPSTGSTPEYDVDRMETDPEYRDQVLADMEKRK